MICFASLTSAALYTLLGKLPADSANRDKSESANSGYLKPKWHMPAVSLMPLFERELHLICKRLCVRRPNVQPKSVSRSLVECCCVWICICSNICLNTALIFCNLNKFGVILSDKYSIIINYYVVSQFWYVSRI